MLGFLNTNQSLQTTKSLTNGLDFECQNQIIYLNHQTDRQTHARVRTHTHTHPFSKDILSRAAYIDGAATSRREKIKHTKYDSQLLPGGYAPTAIPLVFEHYGRWGDEAQQFLKTLSLMSYDEDGHQNASNLQHIGDNVYQFSYNNVMLE